jgi:ribosomal protein S13
MQSSEMGEEQSTTLNKLVDLHKIVTNLKKTRLSYMTALKNLSSTIKLDPSNKIGTETIKELSQNPQAKAAIEKINKYSELYSKYIDGTILPELRKHLEYLKQYFSLIKNIDPKNQSTWQSIKRWFGVGTNKDMADDVLKSLDYTINSLASDLKLRQLEQNDAIQNIQKKIETDLSKEFENTQTYTDVSKEFQK